MKVIASRRTCVKSPLLRLPCRPHLEPLETRELLSACAVDRLTDNNPAGGGEGLDLTGDLRYCIRHGNTITFEDGVTGTINLAAALPSLANVSIEGPGPDLLTVRRDVVAIFRIFAVDDPNVPVSISGLTISNGSVSGGGAAIINGGRLTVSNCTISGNTNLGGLGGGILNDPPGMLTVNNSTISGNTALGGNGGGIYNRGTLTVNNTIIAGNAAGNGGGIYNNTASGVTVMNSTIAGNAAGGGGGIFNGGGRLMVTASTISGNIANSGGGISSAGELTVSNTTIAENSSSNQGGGIFADRIVNVSDSTIAGNFAGNSGGGVYVVTSDVMATRNTIIAGNTAVPGPDVYGNLGSQGYNLVRNVNGGSGFTATDRLNVDPLLGALQNNGGPTRTMALMPGSPALNAGAPDQSGVPDQRGVVRRGAVNIGAYQASASAFALTASDAVMAASPFDLAVAAVDSFGQAAIGYAGTVTFGTSDPDPGVVLPSDYTFRPSDQGMVTFPGGVTLITPGDQTLLATDTANDAITGTVTITVSSAGPGPNAQHRRAASLVPMAIDQLFASPTGARWDAPAWAVLVEPVTLAHQRRDGHPAEAALADA